jgi:hypothetical protein
VRAYSLVARQLRQVTYAASARGDDPLVRPNLLMGRMAQRARNWWTLFVSTNLHPLTRLVAHGGVLRTPYHSQNSEHPPPDSSSVDSTAPPKVPVPAATWAGLWRRSWSSTFAAWSLGTLPRDRGHSVNTYSRISLVHSPLLPLFSPCCPPKSASQSAEIHSLCSTAAPRAQRHNFGPQRRRLRRDGPHRPTS